MPMDVDASVFSASSKRASSRSKIPKWKSESKTGSKDASVLTEKTVPKKSNSTPEVCVQRKDSRVGTRRKIKKSLSSAESSVASKVSVQGRYEKKKITRTHSAIPTPVKRKATNSYSTTPQIGVKPKRQPIGVM